MHIMNKKKQIEIAAHAGITQGYLSKVLSGDAGNPTIGVLLKISDGYGISVQSLLKKISKNKAQKAEKKRAAA
jgi:transcriptional regulator with XRE-family HTH domain